MDMRVCRVDRLRKRVLLRLQQLDMFLILLESGSVRVTADTVGMSQSAVSKSLKELEGMLGTTLFVRMPTGLRPTATAAIFENFARQSIRGYNQMITDLAREQGMDSRPVRFGVMRGLSQKLLNDALASARGHHGEILIRIQVGTTDSLLKSVLSGELELAIMHVPPRQESGDVRYFSVGSETLVALARPDHPVFSGMAPLHEFPWSVPGTMYQLRQEMEKAVLASEASWPSEVIEQDSFAVDLETGQDEIIHWTTQSLAESWLEQGVLKVVPMPFPAPVARIGCFRAAGTPLSRAAVMVWRELVAMSRRGGRASTVHAGSGLKRQTT
jgi:LysR family pca operon transcriptional activator